MNLKLINNMSLNQLMTVYMFDSRTSVLTNDTVDMIYLKKDFNDSFFRRFIFFGCTVDILYFSCTIRI